MRLPDLTVYVLLGALAASNLAVAWQLRCLRQGKVDEESAVRWWRAVQAAAVRAKRRQAAIENPKRSYL